MLALLKYFFRVYTAEKLRKDIFNQNPTCKIGYDFVVTAPQYFTLGLYVDISNYWELKRRSIETHESEMERTGKKWIEFFYNGARNARQKIV